MNTLIIGNQTHEQRRAEIALAAATGAAEPAARLDFDRLEDAWKLISEKRWRIIQTMTGKGPLSIREIARRVDRDVRAVHSDVTLLHHSGVIDRTADGRMVFPYDIVQLDFTFDARRVA
jgi:predicted transcriptional regulator